MKKEWKKLLVVCLSVLLIVATATPVLASPALSTVVIPNTSQLAPTQQFLQQWADWYASSTPSYTRSIQFYLSTNSGLTNVVSYAAGNLVYHPNTGIFDATVTQYFNDRLWAYPASGNYLAIPDNPFNPKKTDQIKVEINKNTGQATITLVSWGNAKVTFNLQYGNQTLYAIANTGDKNWQNVIISCKKIQMDIPK